MNDEALEPLVGAASSPSRSNPRITMIVAIGASVALAGVAGLTASASSSARETAAEGAAIRLVEADGLSFTVGNEYGSEVPGDGYYPWSLIAEPHKLSTLVASEPEGLTLAAGSSASFHWHIPADNKLVWGSSMEHKFTSTGAHEVHLSRYELNPSTGVKAQTHHLSTTVMVRYVKREMRSLTDAARDSFLSALQTVFSTSSEQGTKLYGSSFVGIEQLVREHLYGAGERDCDHWHDDAGIMTHHLGFTLKLELALQSVDSSVTIPYWEYTKDDAEFGTEWRKSPVFQEDWFGNSGENLGSGHYIKQGRWGSLAVMADAQQYSRVTNAYGLLRSPWNLNSEPYVTRSDSVVGQTYMSGSLPGCSAIKSCFDSSTLADMNACLNGETHGPVHVLIGGQWDVKLGSGLGETLIGPAHLLLFKNLWRMGYATCPTTTQEMDAGGACACSSDTTELVGGAYEVLKQSKSLKYMAEGAPNGMDLLKWDADTERWTIPSLTTEAEEEETWKDLLSKLCNPGKVGEMYSSAAPYDPLFWVLHTTSERLLQYRRLRSSASKKDDTALSFNQTWGYTHVSADSDTNVVCDWSDLDAATGLPTCTSGVTCSGHNAEDVLPFDLSALSRGLSAATTNQDFYDWLDPTNADIPYVYDSFKYEHCSAMGLDIGAEVDDDTIDGTPPKSTGPAPAGAAGGVF
mmetsp:Transcript_17451/g.32044  ORF Transcript_17451/g.32044 Transcript_17451/m.32044 type:complete len:688 (+) Transcript_17451:35-2098(+)